MKNEPKKVMRRRIIIISMGCGSFNSFTIGAPTVKVRAMMLQIPMMVAKCSGGNIVSILTSTLFPRLILVFETTSYCAYPVF